MPAVNPNNPLNPVSPDYWFGLNGTSFWSSSHTNDVIRAMNDYRSSWDFMQWLTPYLNEKLRFAMQGYIFGHIDADRLCLMVKGMERYKLTVINYHRNLQSCLNNPNTPPACAA